MRAFSVVFIHYTCPLIIEPMKYLNDGFFWYSDSNPVPVDSVYDDMNDAHAHNLMHIVYMSLEYINDGDHE